MTAPNRTDFVLTEVELERAYQDKIWGEQNHSPLVWLSILGEEFGEVCRALNEWTCGAPGGPADYRKELLQVAAVAAAAVESYDRNNLGG